ncbi:uncharacterized protein F5Z01DRAFT_538711 [Emericellopsis atlantica]|uniref:Uncharacterized protein n=1 Tax=Emericellopsis atlantica TaxID=2614577 RepID=A0A9P7ZPV5_9HYPO|nr:uncharacterized protein F5Z01DRAFT_538711 [Emericellopsis atlantica]KAG9256103.1 hypothetical protein F5Z01DRAFT_538711 [Emericellopsis atlantica]
MVFQISSIIPICPAMLPTACAVDVAMRTTNLTSTDPDPTTENPEEGLSVSFSANAPMRASLHKGAAAPCKTLPPRSSPGARRRSLPEAHSSAPHQPAPAGPRLVNCSHTITCHNQPV